MSTATTGYLTDEAEYTKYTQHTPGAATYPTTGDTWDTWNDFFSDLLNSKIGVDSNVTDDPPLKICKMIVAQWIRRYGYLVKSQTVYASPEQNIENLALRLDTTPENEYIGDVIGYLDTEDPPAYSYPMHYYRGGREM